MVPTSGIETFLEDTKNKTVRCGTEIPIQVRILGHQEQNCLAGMQEKIQRTKPPCGDA